MVKLLCLSKSQEKLITQLLFKSLEVCVGFKRVWKLLKKFVLKSLVLSSHIWTRKFGFENHWLIWKAYWSWLIRTKFALHHRFWAHYLGCFRLVNLFKNLFLRLICVPGLVEYKFLPKVCLLVLIFTAYWAHLIVQFCIILFGLLGY